MTKRASESSGAGEQAGVHPVTVKQALQQFTPPRATYHTTGYTPKRGRRSEAIAIQERIARLRERNPSSPLAEKLFAAMMRDLMVARWNDSARNLVTTQGKNDLLDKYFGGSSYTAAWFCGLISSVSYSALNVADTMASHSGWTEAGGTNAPAYTGNRPALTFGSASAGSKATSSASSFTFTSGGTIKGMFGTSITTKDGTTGILYNDVLFTGGDRVVASGDVVNVSVTYTIT
jgi:hypothetical protein